MINNIAVLENRKLKLTSKRLGVTGENNAEILQFAFPEKIDNYDISTLKKTLYFSNADGTYPLDIVDNSVELSALLTTRTEATMYVELTGDNFLWSTYICDVTFESKPDAEGGGSIIDIVRKEVEDELLIKIRDSFRYNIGGSFDYNELNLNQLIGDRTEDVEGIDNPQPYNNGVLFTTAKQLQTLVNKFTDAISAESIDGIYDNTSFLVTETDKIRGYVINAINRTLGTDYPPDTSWVELNEAVQKLPDDVEIKVDGIVSDTIIETTGKAETELTMSLVAVVNKAFNEEILSNSVNFDDNVGAVADKVKNTIETIKATMYDEQPSNLTYTQAIDRIDESRTELENAVGGTVGDTFPTLIEKAKSRGEIADYLHSIVTSIESQTDVAQFYQLTLMGTKEHLVRLPYINTSKQPMNFQGGEQPKFCEELGFDVSSLTYLHYNKFRNCPYTRKLILTGLDRRNKLTIQGTFYQTFYGLTNLEELYVDRICGIGYSTTNYYSLFGGLSKLKIIGGFNSETRTVDNVRFGVIDFTDCIDTSLMFTGCITLQHVRFTSNTLTINLDMSNCYRLSKESALSAINACGTVSTATTLKLSIINPNIQITDPDIASAVAIATAKGYTVSYG